MRYALTGERMRALENRVVTGGTTTLGSLMEHAGAALAAEVSWREPSGPVIVLCGPGNNGGDGWVAARVLHLSGRSVSVVSVVAPSALRDEAAAAADSALTAGVPYEVFPTGGPSPTGLADASVVIDALFGFGFHGAMREPAAGLVAALESAGGCIVSADVPSGVDADTGAVSGPAVRADLTVTFTALKPGLLIYPGADHAGEVVVADIGIAEDAAVTTGGIEVPEAGDLRCLLPVSTPDAHKGSQGRLAIVAGSRAYSGAAVLAARGALRMGVGYVIAVVPDVIADVIRVSLPGVIVRAVPATSDGSIARVDAVMSAISDADAVVIGPGLTTAPGVGEVVHALLAGVTAPLLLDADALNVLAGDTSALDAAPSPLVLTPHPGEAARLLGVTPDAVQADRVAAASALAGQRRVCLLKGARSVVAGPDRRALVRAGNAGLARAGSGDVLTGMAGALLARGLAPFDAALLAAYLHGRAAEHGSVQFTEMCFTSEDIVSFLPDAVREVRGG